MRFPSLPSLVLAAAALGCGGAAPSLDHQSSPVRSEGAAVVAPAAFAKPSAPRGALAAAPAPEPPKSACAPRAKRSVKIASRSGSSIAIVESAGRKLAYVADDDNRAVHVLDADSLTELAVTALPGRPAAILPLADGRLLVTLRDKNRLAVLEPGDAPEDALETRCERATPIEPFGLAVSPDGSRVALTAGWDHKLMIFDAAALTPERIVDLAAEPRGVLISSDGQTAYVSHMIGGVVSSVSLERPADAAHRVFLRPALPPAKTAKTAKKNGPAAAKSEAEKTQELASTQGFALAELSLGTSDSGPWPARIFVPMASSDPMRFSDRRVFPNVYGGGGGPAVIGAFIAVYDPKAGAPLGGEVAPLREGRPEDCILPRGIAVHNDRILVTCLGINSIVELDARAVDPISAERRRFSVGAGPTGVAVDEAKGRALVFSQWSGEVTAIDLAEATKNRTAVLRLAAPSSPALSPTLARGRELFHVTRDVRISFDGRACASCHPDGRADGLTWATPDGPRQTIWLAGRVDGSGPFGWFGEHPTTKMHVSFTVGRLGGHGFESTKDAADLDALLSYVASISGPSLSGALEDEGASILRERGKELFFSSATGCSTCHLERAGDGKRHDVGTGDALEKGRSFDTPGLGFVGGSAPYFHDGRYATLIELLRDPASKMGTSSQLGEADQRALAAYLGSL